MSESFLLFWSLYLELYCFTYWNRLCYWHIQKALYSTIPQFERAIIKLNFDQHEYFPANMNWLTHDLGTRTGGWEFDRSQGAGTSSPSHWQQVEENRRRHLWIGWCVSSWWPLFLSRGSVLIYIYIYTHIYIYMLFYMSSVFFGLPIVSCSLMIDNNLIPGCLWLLAFVLNNTLIPGIWCSTILHLRRCLCP